MFTCPQCSRIFAGVIEITKHLKYFHTFGHFKFPRLVCPSISCSVDISTWSGFLRHIKSHGEVIDNNFINSLEDHENNIAQPVLLNPSIDKNFDRFAWEILLKTFVDRCEPFNRRFSDDRIRILYF